jgi:uncharacterized protein
MANPATAALAQLATLLQDLAPVAVAVSGGVDSLTLGLIASRTLGSEARCYHAVSPAVPAAASTRVRELARREGWNLTLLDAGEFGDAAYRSNPYRRCFHCKQNLYRALAERDAGTLLSGTNTDDLTDFRPGLEAAAQFGVRHPFADCGIGKDGIRALCRLLGYPELARLPAAPCLSSRVQTGIPIEPAVLGFVDQVETWLRTEAGAQVVRCRIQPETIAVQLDPAALGALAPPVTAAWGQRIGDLAAPLGLPRAVRFQPYVMGSAFVPGP